MNCSHLPVPRLRASLAAASVAVSAAMLMSNPVLAVWPPPEGLPMTRWAKEVSPDKPVLPEYPRPQLGAAAIG